MAHELHTIADCLLAARPRAELAIQAQAWDEEAFGSGWITLARGDDLFRLVWDGKDGWAHLQRRTPTSSWVDIAGPILEADFRNGIPDPAKIDVLANALLQSLSLESSP